MGGSVNEVLRDIIQRHGPALLDDHRRCEACLHDSSLSSRDISGVVAALKAGVAKRIATMPELGDKGVASLARELAESRGLNDKLASQSVEAWAFALQKDYVKEKQAAPIDPPLPREPQTGTRVAAICVWIVSVGLLLTGFFAFGPSPSELSACIQRGGSGTGCPVVHFPAQLFWLLGVVGFGYGGKLWVRKTSAK